MLNDCDRPAEICAVLDLDKAAQQDMVDERAIAADVAIVANVRADHEQIVVFYNCRCVIFPTPMNGDILTDAIAIPDRKHAAWFMLMQMLGHPPDDSSFTNLIVAADRGSRFNRDSSG